MTLNIELKTSSACTSLVNNAYGKNCNKIRKQTKGLQMGTNPATRLAGLHCPQKETTAKDRLKLIKRPSGQIFLWSYRYVDDIVSTATASLQTVGISQHRHNRYTRISAYGERSY